MPSRFPLPQAVRTPAFGTAVLAVSSLLGTSLSASAAPAPTLVRLPDHVPSVTQKAQKLTPVAANTKVSVLITLQLRDGGGVNRLLAALYDPKSPLYGHYVTPEDFTARFGPTQADYDAVTAFAKSKGLTVTTYPGRTLLGVKGTAAAVEGALSLSLNNYKFNNQTFFAPDINPGFPAAVAGKINGVLGLSSYAKLTPQFKILTPAQRAAAAAAHPLVPKAGGSPDAVKIADFGGGTGHGGAFSPHDLRLAYDLGGVPATGKGQTIALYEEGGFFADDVDRYKDFYNLPDVPVVVRTVDGFSGAVDDLGVSEEAALDIDMALALAPGAGKILVYESQPAYPQGLISALNAMAQDNKAGQVSISYGLAEDIVGSPAIKAENRVLKQLAAEGVSVFASSGDQGAYTDGITPAAVSDPASQPYITGVGGTALYTDPTGAYLGETTWNELGLFGAAGGGGVSKVWTIPNYQVSASPDANGGSAKARNVPDVAADGAILTGVDVYSLAAGGWSDFGGTSVSSPIWAGFTARVNEVRSSAGLTRLGFANPAIYTIGASFLSFFDFHDIIDGTNGNQALYGTPGFAAGFGYDDVTGYGSFDGANLITDLGAAPSSNVAPPAAPTYFLGIAGNKSVKLVWKASKGAKGYFLYRIPGPNNGSFLKSLKGTTYTDTTVANGTLYEYLLEAVGAGGGTPAAYPIYVEPSATSGQ